MGAVSLPGLDHSLRIDALIGLELLRRTSLSIDYEAKEIVFGPVTHSGPTLSFYGRLPIIPVPFEIGGKRLSLLLDTGAEHLILYQRRVEGELRMRRTGEKLPIRSLGRRLNLRKVFVSDASLGETKWSELPAYLLDVPIGKTDPDGVLGVAALGLKRLHLDFRRNQISWEIR